MKAFVVDRYGKGDGARFGDMPEPVVRAADVLVRVHAAGVNVLDSKIRDGEFKLILPYRLPLILGNDVAGVVIRVGSKVRRFKAGDEVYARPHKDRIGAFAEFISMNEDNVAIKPKALTMEEAASIPSYSFLFMRANGDQLREITSLIDAGIIRPIVAKVFPFELMKEALAYVDTGRAKGKVVVKVR
ncbi:MAG: NADP-dependent oxidoreductase [Pyrinomonadaceae bacterium]